MASKPAPLPLPVGPYTVCLSVVIPGVLPAPLYTGRLDLPAGMPSQEVLAAAVLPLLARNPHPTTGYVHVTVTAADHRPIYSGPAYHLPLGSVLLTVFW